MSTRTSLLSALCPVAAIYPAVGRFGGWHVWVVRGSPVRADPSTRRADIQGLRAFAVLVVVAFHASLPVPGGFVGVDVFFVISGFVICGLLHREWLSSGSVRLRTFYVRRFRRLAPAMAVMLVVTLALSVVLLSPFGAQQTTARTALAATLLVANAAIAQNTGGYFAAIAQNTGGFFEAPAETQPLLHTWSLSVEEQFYLAFPALLLASWLIGRPEQRRLDVALVGFVAIASLALMLTAAGQPPGPGQSWLFGFYSPLTRAWEFALGALLALLSSRVRLNAPQATLIGAAGVVALLSSLWLISEQTPFPSVWTLLPVIGTILVLLSGTQKSTLWARAWSWRPAVLVGDWSYSIYLWHWPLIVFAGQLWPNSEAALVLAAGLSLLPAIGSYYLIEQPIRRDPGLSPHAVARVAAFTVATPVTLSIAVYAASTSAYWLPDLAPALRAVNSVPPGYSCFTVGTDQGNPTVPLPDPDTCELRTGAGPPIFLLGDSTAAHLAGGVESAAIDLDSPLTVATAAGCQFIDVYRYSSEEALTVNDRQCRQYYEETMEWLSRQDPGIVVLAGTDAYWRGRVAVGSNDRSPAPAVNRNAILEDALSRTVRVLNNSGHQVVLVQALPIPAVESSMRAPTQCGLRALLDGSCGQARPASSLAEQSARRATLGRVSAETGATLLDFREGLCPSGLCRSQLGNVWVFRDRYHVSDEFSRSLGGLFRQAFEVGAASDG